MARIISSLPCRRVFGTHVSRVAPDWGLWRIFYPLSYHAPAKILARWKMIPVYLSISYFWNYNLMVLVSDLNHLLSFFDSGREIFFGSRHILEKILFFFSLWRKLINFWFLKQWMNGKVKLAENKRRSRIRLQGYKRFGWKDAFGASFYKVEHSRTKVDEN